MTSEICGVLLAAGSSKRFGSNKLLHELSNNETIIYASAKKLIEVLPNSIAVVKSKNSEIYSVLTSLNFQIIENQQHENGIGSSIRCAVKHTSSGAWVFALADMPFIQSESIHQVATLLEEGYELVAPKYKDTRGHPVGISSVFKSELLKLNDDYGAKEIIKQNSKHLKTFTTDDSGVTKDIDTLTDISS